MINQSKRISAVVSGEEYEYWCNNCKQLRLFLKEGKPSCCGNCNSKDIVVEKAGRLDADTLRADNG